MLESRSYPIDWLESHAGKSSAPGFRGRAGFDSGRGDVVMDLGRLPVEEGGREGHVADATTGIVGVPLQLFAKPRHRSAKLLPKAIVSRENAGIRERVQPSEKWRYRATDFPHAPQDILPDDGRSPF